MQSKAIPVVVNFPNLLQHRKRIAETSVYHRMEMLNSLNALAGKISPQNGATGAGSTAANPAKVVVPGGSNHNNNNNNNSPHKAPAVGVIMDTSATSNGIPTSPQMNMNSNMTNSDQPDPDAIKMFVGQIPRSMDENDLRKMFEEFGKVYQINVLRDKVTGQSKGCCFVTFYTRKAALEAQNALHNIKTLAGMHHPIQMKPADSENRNERKLFVGMLSKKCTENDVRVLFGPYGTIEECTVLRDTNGQSKGCAFVTYTSKQCAINAIKTMHHSQTMEGCSSPLVVKFADTQKEKDQKRLQQMQANLWNLAGVNMGPQYLALLQQMQASGQNLSTLSNMQQLINVGSLGVQHLQAASQGVTNNAGLQNLAALQSSTGLNLTGSTGGTGNEISSANLQGLATLANLSVANPNVNPMSMQNLVTLAAITGGNGASLQAISPSGSSASGLSSPGEYTVAEPESIPEEGRTLLAAHYNWLGWGNQALSSLTNSTAALLSKAAVTGSIAPQTSTNNSLGGVGAVSPVTSMGLGPLSNNALNTMASMTSINGLGSSTGIATNGGSLDALTSAYPGIQQYTAGFPSFTQAGGSGPAGKQIEGPEGANLFIYHLPQEFSDSDLAQTFLPFGTVISAKVFIDKQTNLSKCFGFVSYDNPVSAQAAIQAMNGFQIGTKRLKVQLKRSKEASRPY